MQRQLEEVGLNFLCQALKYTSYESDQKFFYNIRDPTFIFFNSAQLVTGDVSLMSLLRSDNCLETEINS